MKNKSIFIFLVLLISSILFGCKWTVPEKVSVKTNADYNFSAGSIDYPMDNYLDIRNFVGDLPGGMKLYDYWPGKNSKVTEQRYLIDIPIAQIPLNFEKFMDDLDFSSKVGEVNIPTTSFEVPKITANFPSVKFQGLKAAIEGAQYLGKDTESLAISVPQMDYLIPAGGGLKTVKIAEGSTLNVAIEGLPKENIDFELTPAGGFTLGGDGSGTAVDGIIQLKDATIKAGVPVTFNVKVTITDIKEIDLNQVGEYLTINITPNITKISEATFDMGKEFKQNLSLDLPAEATKAIEKITLQGGDAGTGLDVTYINSLPAGNDITLTVNSNFLGLTNKSLTFKGNTVNKANGKIRLDSNKESIIGDTTKVDFVADIKLPGSEPSAPTLFKITNLEIGKPYTIDIQIKPQIKWVDVTVRSGVLNNFKTDRNQEIPINLNQTFKDFGTKLGDPNMFDSIELPELPVYLTCTKPTGVEAFNNLEFNGTVELKVGEESLGYLLGGTSSPADISPIDKLPDLKLENKTVTADFSKFKAGTDVSLIPEGVNNTFNRILKTNGNLNVQYNLNVTGGDSNAIVIKADQLKGTSEISVRAYIDLGMKLKSSKDIKMNLLKVGSLSNMEGKDLLNGNGKTIKDQGTDQYAKIIERLAISLDVSKLPINISNPFEFRMDIANVKEPWVLNLQQGKPFEIELTKAQIDDIFEPAVPELKINELSAKIPAGDFSIPRIKDIGATLKLNLKTNGTVKLIEKGADGKYQMVGGSK